MIGIKIEITDEFVYSRPDIQIGPHMYAFPQINHEELSELKIAATILRVGQLEHIDRMSMPMTFTFASLEEESEENSGQAIDRKAVDGNDVPGLLEIYYYWEGEIGIIISGRSVDDTGEVHRIFSGEINLDLFMQLASGKDGLCE